MSFGPFCSCLSAQIRRIEPSKVIMHHRTCRLILFQLFPHLYVLFLFCSFYESNQSIDRQLKDDERLIETHTKSERTRFKTKKKKKKTKTGRPIIYTHDWKFVRWQFNWFPICVNLTLKTIANQFVNKTTRRWQQQKKKKNKNKK